jgi:S1-C subfamily serine protease
MTTRPLALLLALLLAASSAAAQDAAQKPAATTDAKSSDKKPAKKPAAAAQKKQEPAATEVPAAPKALKDSYLAVPLAERIAIQSDLVWSGDYNGGVNGDFGDRTIAAIKAYQKRTKGKDTGILLPEERSALGTAVKAQQERVGWRIVEDPTLSGLRLGIPARLAPQTSQGKSGGRWTSARGEVQIETFATKAEGGTINSEFERQKKAFRRAVEYNVIKPDFFELSGLQGLKNFYIRAQMKDNDIRGVTILYDQAMDGIMEPVVVAMSSAFSAFDAGTTTSTGRRKVEYSTGLIVSAAGHIIADRQATEACNVITIAGRGNAERIAEDPASDLALLRFYSAAKVTPVPLATDPPKGTDVTLVGIADPQLQNGANAISVANAKLAGVNGATVLLEPAPVLGFSGAPALDSQGQLVGMVEIKLQNAGPAGPTQAALVPTATIKTFLDKSKIAALTGRTTMDDAKAAVARVICVRK